MKAAAEHSTVKFSRPIVIILALLQLMAPLAHAHAGNTGWVFQETGSGKLHIPGLESLNGGYRPVMAELSDRHDLGEGWVIGVDAGIKQTQDKPAVDSPESTCLLLPALLFGQTAASTAADYHTSDAPACLIRLMVAIHTPRAPPAL